MGLGSAQTSVLAAGRSGVALEEQPQQPQLPHGHQWLLQTQAKARKRLLPVEMPSL